MTKPRAHTMISRSRHPRRLAFTLMELTTSITIMVILLGALTSVIVIASQALPDSEDPAQKKLAAMDVVDQIARELFYATSITEETERAVTFTVADRGHGAAGPETIRYEWSGTPGDPLTRQYNGGAAVTVCDGVQDFSLAYLRKAKALDGPPRVLLVIGPDNATDEDAARQATMESWGCTVTPIADASTEVEFHAAAWASDIIYISKEVRSGDLQKLPFNPAVGIVDEEGALYPDLGFSASDDTASDRRVVLTDNAHEITAGFSLGTLDVTTSSIGIPLTGGQRAPGARVLAGFDSKTALMVIEMGDELYGGEMARGRRVKLCWADGDLDFSWLTGDALKIMRRSIVWAAAPVVYSGVQIVLQAAGDPEGARTEVQVFNTPKVNAP